MTTEIANDVRMPHLGVSVEEGTVTRWLKREGDAVGVDEPVLEISTDKVDTEVVSAVAGTITKILVGEGETVPVGTILAEIGAAGVPATVPAPDPVVAESTAAAPAAAPPAPVNGDVPSGAKLLSPLVSRMLAEHRLDPSTIAGTGRNGRITKQDVLAAIEAGPAAAPVAVDVAPPVAAPPAPAAEPAVEVTVPAAGVGEEFEAMSPMRRSIAEHMRRSMDTSAHASSITEVDMSAVRAVRASLKREYEQAHGVNLTYLAFIAHATVETLRDYPWINGEIRGDKIVTKKFVNLGVAVEVQEGKGLVVPVIKNAEGLNLLGMAAAIADIANRARNKKLRPEDLQGGSFTITNPGGYGITGGNPIINQPQSAILGTFAVVDRPWAVKDASGQATLGIRPIMNLSVTYDHRLVDGAYAARFLRDLRKRLETWS